MTNLGNIFQTKLTLVRTCTKTTIIYDSNKINEIQYETNSQIYTDETNLDLKTEGVLPTDTVSNFKHLMLLE